jgi:hypothetical protein
MLSLNEMVDLPLGTASAVIARAADLRSELLFSQAAAGDIVAQRALVKLQFAYLVWAYATPVVHGAMSDQLLDVA